MAEDKAVEVTISDEALEALEEIARMRGISLEDALKQALVSERFITRQVLDGAKILVKRPDKPARELVEA